MENKFIPSFTTRKETQAMNISWPTPSKEFLKDKGKYLLYLQGIYSVKLVYHEIMECGDNFSKIQADI